MSVRHYVIDRPSGRGLVVAALAVQVLIVLAGGHAGAAATTEGVAPAGVARGSSSGLSAVVALSRTDVWTVGSYVARRSGGASLLAEHWDGSTWSVIHVPRPTGRWRPSRRCPRASGWSARPPRRRRT